jgi:4-hydroxybenzoate polyprenyltransferase
MPFAMVGYFLAVADPNYSFSWVILGLVTLCMVFARNAAMAFNRWRDRDIDEKNPRTKVREIPAGVVSPNEALIFVVFNSMAFIMVTYFINQTCFYLSPVALAVILGYTYTKRFTSLCHLVLGLGLSLAPIGAYLAVVGQLNLVPVLYGIAVLFWVAGFDIIYALQDEDFDRSLELQSLPVAIGKKNALILSTIFHLITSMVMLWAAIKVQEYYPNASTLHWIVLSVFIILLIYQHTLVKPNDLSKVNLAFFSTNGLASLIFGTLVVIDLIF